MGQQQLLLLVFGIVLVGGAVVAGAHVLEGENWGQNRSLVIHEALAIVHELQVWKQKPTLLRGGANLTGFDQVSFGALGYSYTLLSNRVHKTENGCYTLRTLGPNNVAELTISAPTCAKNDYVTSVLVSGTGPADLDWQR